MVQYQSATTLIDSLLKGSGLGSYSQGFGFGAGYGSGVRFGYTDLYPNMKELISKIPFFGAGYDSGATQKQGIQPQPLKLPKWW